MSRYNKKKKRTTLLVKDITPRVAKYSHLPRIAKRVHSTTGGHPGKNKTEQMIRQNWIFKYVRKFASDIVENCDCQAVKRSKIKRKNVRKMKIRKVSNKSLEMWAIDCIEMKKSASGNTHIYTATDMHSKWRRAKAGRQPNAERIADWIVHDIIAAYGAIRICLSDNGSEFKNELIKIMSTKYGFKQQFIEPYRSQS